jgi:hypothetical protein
MFATNVFNLRKVSGFVRTAACCRVVLNALSSYNSMAPDAETSAYITFAVPVMRDASRGALLSLRKEV